MTTLKLLTNKEKGYRKMSKLYFRYSPMNAGKSTALLQVAHNYIERGQKPIIAKPTIDTKSEHVLSRLKISAKVDWSVDPDENIIIDYLEKETDKIDCILVDEAQFLQPTQVDELFIIATQHNIPVLAYGIRSDFQTRAFPGAVRLFELAHTIEEMKTICECGSKAMFNGRMVNGEFTNKGEQVAIDGGDIVTYTALCGKCYINYVGWNMEYYVSIAENL